MPVKEDYERELVIDVDQYLIDNYSGMSLTIRRAICDLVLSHGALDGIHEEIDLWVSNYAMIKQKFTTLDNILNDETEEESGRGADNKSTGS